MNISSIELAERCEEWQQRLSSLGIAHWRIACVTITDNVPSDTASGVSYAGVVIDENYDTLRLYFNADFVEGATAKELDEVILHEFVHVAFRDLNNAIDLAKPWFPEAAWDTYDDNLEHKKESITERFARQLYAFAKPKSHPRTTK